MKAPVIHNKEELIKALRYCGKGTGCYNCPIYHEPTEKCFEIMTDAADALEVAEKRIAELEKDIIYWQTYAAEIER